MANIKIASYSNAEEYCDAVFGMANKLRNVDEQVSDEEQFLWLVNGLPRTFEHAKSAALANLHLNLAVSGQKKGTVGTYIVPAAPSVLKVNRNINRTSKKL